MSTTKDDTGTELFFFDDATRRECTLHAAECLRVGDVVWGRLVIKRAPDADTEWARMTVIHGLDGFVAIPQGSGERLPLTGERRKRAEDAWQYVQGARYFVVVGAGLGGPIARTQDGAYWSWVKLVRERAAEHLADAGSPAMYAATTEAAAQAADVSEAQGTGSDGGRFWRLHSVTMR